MKLSKTNRGDTLYTMRSDAVEHHYQVVTSKGKGKPSRSNSEWIESQLNETRTYDQWVEEYLKYRTDRPGFKGNVRGALDGSYITVNCIINDSILVKSDQYLSARDYAQAEGDWYHYGEVVKPKKHSDNEIIAMMNELVQFTKKPTKESEYLSWINTVVLAIETIAGDRISRETRYAFATQAFERALRGRSPLRGSIKMIIQGW
jgi:hypothetical protein